jgi:hypothetical protein
MYGTKVEIELKLIFLSMENKKPAITPAGRIGLTIKY